MAHEWKGSGNWTTHQEIAADSHDNQRFILFLERAASASWSVVSGADWNAIDFVVVGAVQAEPFMRVVWVHACIFRCEFLATHRWPMVHGAQRDAFDVSSVFKVCAVSATFYMRLSSPPFYFEVSEGSMGSMM
ncbi:MAG: hypothetical protein NWE99_04630 [Candidatus Bathyarchaeota archaeon]|nr:hypothetical protein [Candidatus Bathyarchaeota archaeon]